MKKLVLLVMLLTLSLRQGFAEEGMWLLTQIDKLDLKKQGLKIKVSDIYNPDGISLTQAIVNLGGASAELVSPEGLLLTNHHVAFGGVQRASINADDYITKGFFAPTRKDEIPAPGYIARVLLEMKDVTEEVVSALQGMEDPVQRKRAVRAKIKSMTDAIEGDREDITARIAEMFEGQQYILYVQQSFEDVRLVYVPPLSIGKYGGDIDNWMWPRHTGDFAFLRVYMAPDGKGRKYNEENIPYKPKKWLKVAKEPLKEGDLTFIMGFPGRTNRYRTSYAVDYSLNHFYPRSIENFKEMIDLLESKAQEDPIVARKVAGFLSGLNNAMKNYQGNLDGMQALNFLEKKQVMEQELQAFINADRDLKARYGTVLEAIADIYRQQVENRENDEILSAFGRMSGTLPGIANQIAFNAQQRSLPEDEREPGFSESDIERGLQRLHFTFMSFDEGVDKALLNRTLHKAKRMGDALHLESLKTVAQGDRCIKEIIDEMYSNTRLTDLDYVKEMYRASLDDLKSIDDPLIAFALKLYPDLQAKRKTDEKREALLSELSRRYIEMLQNWKKTELYPDANGTIRFTYGKVSGYEPRDAVYYQPFTTLGGVIEKHTGEEPFDAPQKLHELHKQRDYGKWADPQLGGVPVAFIHECDITGGNSGSPVMNARGELIGIAFDGNYEALTGDWEFIPDLQRTISVDIRYVLFVTEKFAGADYILKEMGIK